jgi:transcriptional repressor NF-X1
MQAEASGQPATQTQSASRSRARRSRGAKRGRGGVNASDILSFRPASVAPAAQHPAANHTIPETSVSDNASRNRPSRRGRGRGGRGNQSDRRTADGRQFGGQLTQTDAQAQLQAEAAEFVPSQQAASRPKAKAPPKQPRQQKRRMSKSQAPDIATRTHEDIDNGHYECPICTSEVQRNSKVWACHTCWTAFHLTCIKKWSTNQGSTVAVPNAQGEVPPPRQWRCPGCNLPKDDLPKYYSCWCGKEDDPKPLTGIPPHSCGQSCGRERARKCPHPCQLTCHAGPCPPCTHMGPTQICFCGKHEVTKRCSDTDYDSGWSCGEVCDEMMPCGEHTCPRPCHEGFCGGCEERVPAKCYCGQVEKELLCADRGDEKESQRTHAVEGNEPVVESWKGMFVCGNLCEREFDCGVHKCQKECHTQDTQASHCPRSPDVVAHCPCGKTALTDISDKPREICQDPIPSCTQPCGKTLPCGHPCEQICHTGNCGNCKQTVVIQCRCGRTASNSICHQGKAEAPLCMRVCRTLLNCGRHGCDERCCAGERKASERLSTKRRQRPLHSAPRPVDDMFEAEHICTRQCGRLLKCGTHMCEELCHKGPCGTCREAIFDEIGCRCGRTVLQPPLPCGTKSPPCRYACERAKACGHPQVPHNCHQDDEACPKCPFLMEKRCMCGKKTLKNQQCWLSDVRCGDVCGHKLRCGSHFCFKPCHRPGECEDANGQACQQPCGKPKKTCGHPDENTCHAPFPCKEEKPCQSKIFITCDCQTQKQEMKCNASKDTEGNNGRSLACNEECARLERNRKLAIALNIDKSLHTDGGDHIPYSTETLNLFGESPKWAQMQEREFRVFAMSDDEKRLRFKPMKARERVFIHHLAEDFGMDSESMDPEPHRHVMIWKTPRFVSAPNKTLAECLRIRQAQRSAAGSAYNSDNEGAKKVKASNAAAEPFNSFVISNPKFGLTVEELRPEIIALVPSSSPTTFDIEFLPNEEVVLKAMTRSLSAQDVQQFLQSVKDPLATAISSKGYGSLQLCCTDSSLNVHRRESEPSGGDGWSRVAAKKAAPRLPMVSTPSSSGLNSFAALTGGKVTFAKKTPLLKPKVKKEAVVDDWEAAEIAEEEKEKVAIEGSNGEEDPGAAVKIVPVVESDTGKIVKLEEEPVNRSAGSAGSAESNGLASSSEPSQIVSEPAADVTPESVD